jgi:hypothetical protein
MWDDFSSVQGDDETRAACLLLAGLCCSSVSEAQISQPGFQLLIKWLKAHPDVNLISRVDLGGNYDLARVRRKGHSEICVINTPADKPRLWCWREKRAIDHLGHQNIAVGKERTDPFKARLRLAFTPGGAAGQAPAVELRFPEARRRASPPVKFVARHCPPRPHWIVDPCVSFSVSNPRGPNKARWGPIKLLKPTPAWAWILAANVLTRVEVPRNPAGRPIIAIQSQDMADQKIVFGLHQGGRWHFSDPITDQEGLLENWSVLGWRPADRLFGKPGLAVHLTTNDGGNMEWEGAAYWFFFEQQKAGLVYAGRLKSGRVKNQRQRGPNGYFRSLERQQCAMKIVAKNCVRLRCGPAERLCTDGAFRPNKRCKRRRFKPRGNKNLQGTWRLRGESFKHGRCGGR